MVHEEKIWYLDPSFSSFVQKLDNYICRLRPFLRSKVKILEQVSSSEKLTNFCNFMSRGGKLLKIDILKRLHTHQLALVAEMI